MSICPKTDGEHGWFECFRQADPPARVFDCACGARRKIYGSGTQGEIEDVVPHPGGSIHNCLVHVEGMSVIQQLGDPQGDRMRALQQETTDG